MRTRRVASIALLAASLCGGCVSYQPAPALETRPDPPAPIRIYVVPEMALPVENAKPLTQRQLANLLKAAGFEAVVATEMAEVPPDAAFVARGTEETGDCSDSVLETILFDLTLGLYPQHRCLKFGHHFEFHQSVSGPVQELKTDWQMPLILGWLAIPLGSDKGYASGWFIPPWDETFGREVAVVRVALLDALRRDEAPAVH